MIQDIPYFYMDNLSRDLRILDEMYIGRSVIVGVKSQLSGIPTAPATAIVS